MKRQTSIYLDLVRFSAAMVVFLGHVAGQRLTGGLFWQFHPFMELAVMVFFVLSGYVIAYATFSRENSPKAYFVSRAARIYSVAVPTVLLVLVLDSIGSAVRPSLYTADWGFHAPNLLSGLSYMLFTNQIWYSDIHFGSAGSYWSLGFEVWYYVLFAFAVFARGWARMALLAAAALIAGPRILLFAPLWGIGVVCYFLTARSAVSERLGWALLASSLVAAAVLGHAVGAGTGPSSHVVLRYLTGSIFALNILGFNAVGHHFSAALKAVTGPVRWLAGMTFSLYLIHVPVAQFIAAVSPLPPSSSLERVLVFGGTLAAVAVFAELTERRKMVWHRAIEALMARAASLSPRGLARSAVLAEHEDR